MKLVAGVGNVFLGDDGFGVEVARRMLAAPVSEGVEIADYGIRGLHLAYRLLDGVDLLVLVDALARGQAPGTIYVLEPDPDAPAPDALDAHGLDPATVLAMVRQLGGAPVRTVVVGCEPASLEERIGLSAQVEDAIPRAIDAIRRLLR